MLFPTATFALFFLAVLPVSWMLMPRQRAWRPFIVLASYVFYMSFVPIYGLLVFGLAVSNYLLGLWINRSRWPGAVLAVAIESACSPTAPLPNVYCLAA